MWRARKVEVVLRPDDDLRRKLSRLQELDGDHLEFVPGGRIRDAAPENDGLEVLEPRPRIRPRPFANLALPAGDACARIGV